MSQGNIHSELNRMLQSDENTEEAYTHCKKKYICELFYVEYIF